jgi:uncharacterized protein YndB with AHSA1/START domain
MDEVSIHVDAPAERVWALLTDVTRMGEWSPETYRCRWTGDMAAPAVGATFRGSNKRGLMRWSNDCTVTVADEPDRFEWEVRQSGMRWGYRFEPDGVGTKVTEYREQTRQLPLYVRVAYASKLLGRDPDAIILRGMRETLERVKAAAESPAPATPSEPVDDR